MSDHHTFENWDEDEEGGEGSQQIAMRYKDAYSLGPRDDLLPPNEIKRLNVVHDELHKQLIIKAKQLKEERSLVKEGKLTGNYTPQFGLGGGGGVENSRFKKHPISDKFSGIRDQKVTAIPRDFTSETNEELADRLENRLENRLTNKPTNTPTLRRY